MCSVLVEMMPPPMLPAAACAVRRCAVGRYVARQARTLRDAVRAADLPLPVAAAAASLCSLVIVVTSPVASYPVAPQAIALQPVAS